MTNDMSARRASILAGAIVAGAMAISPVSAQQTVPDSGWLAQSNWYTETTNGDVVARALQQVSIRYVTEVSGNLTLDMSAQGVRQEVVLLLDRIEEREVWQLRLLTGFRSRLAQSRLLEIANEFNQTTPGSKMFVFADGQIRVERALAARYGLNLKDFRDGFLMQFAADLGKLRDMIGVDG